jgi:hypothetical protein
MSLCAAEIAAVAAELQPLVGARVRRERVHAERALTLELYGRAGAAGAQQLAEVVGERAEQRERRQQRQHLLLRLTQCRLQQRLVALAPATWQRYLAAVWAAVVGPADQRQVRVPGSVRVQQQQHRRLARVEVQHHARPAHDAAVRRGRHARLPGAPRQGASEDGLQAVRKTGR